MSYAEDIRGALAQVSGASRRVVALKELGMPEEDNVRILHMLDEATDKLIAVQMTLQKHGITARGLGNIAASAGEDKSWRERIYGGKKDDSPPGRRVSTPAPTPSAPAIDVAHPWRSE